MPSMNAKNFGLTGVASTDLGMGDALQDQAEAQILEQKKKKRMGDQSSALSGVASQDLLGQATGNT